MNRNPRANGPQKSGKTRGGRVICMLIGRRLASQMEGAASACLSVCCEPLGALALLCFAVRRPCTAVSGSATQCETVSVCGRASVRGGQSAPETSVGRPRAPPLVSCVLAQDSWAESLGRSSSSAQDGGCTLQSPAKGATSRPANTYKPPQTVPGGPSPAGSQIKTWPPINQASHFFPQIPPAPAGRAAGSGAWPTFCLEQSSARWLGGRADAAKWRRPMDSLWRRMNGGESRGGIRSNWTELVGSNRVEASLSSSKKFSN